VTSVFADLTTVPPPDLGTPIPEAELVHTTLMFCEPLTQGTGSDLKIGVAPLDVIYTGEGCFADIDSSGFVAPMDESGTAQRVGIEYVPVDDVQSPRLIVWVPARGELNGESVVMTGAFIAQDAKLYFSAMGAPEVVYNTTVEGQQVFGSLTERMIGLPLAVFLDNKPLTSDNGRDIIAPRVQARIDDAIVTYGLSLDDGKRLVALFNYGKAR
jgi:preprotein translocase subunit SecD